MRFKNVAGFFVIIALWCSATPSDDDSVGLSSDSPGEYAFDAFEDNVLFRFAIATAVATWFKSTNKGNYLS